MWWVKVTTSLKLGHLRGWKQEMNNVSCGKVICWVYAAIQPPSLNEEICLHTAVLISLHTLVDFVKYRPFLGKYDR